MTGKLRGPKYYICAFLSVSWLKCICVQCSVICYSLVREWSVVKCSGLECSAMMCSAVQCKYSVVLWSLVQYSALYCNAVQCITMHSNEVECRSVQGSQVQCSAVQCRTHTLKWTACEQGWYNGLFKSIITVEWIWRQCKNDLNIFPGSGVGGGGSYKKHCPWCHCKFLNFLTVDSKWKSDLNFFCVGF